MDDATQWMRLLGALALVVPFIMSRIPQTRPHARRVGLCAAVLYIGFAVAFVAWYLLIRPA